MATERRERLNISCGGKKKPAVRMRVQETHHLVQGLLLSDVQNKWGRTHTAVEGLMSQHNRRRLVGGYRSTL